MPRILGSQGEPPMQMALQNGRGIASKATLNQDCPQEAASAHREICRQYF